MKQTLAFALLLACSPALATETNDTVTLSGLLHVGKPMVHLAPYYLDVTVAGGGTQRFWLTGTPLKQFDQQIKNSGGGCVPVQVIGRFRTQYTGKFPSPQPTSPGWMIWLEVKKVTASVVTDPGGIMEGANKTPEHISEGRGRPPENAQR